MLATAGASYLVDVAALVLFAAAGTIPYRTALAYAVVAVLAVAVFALLIRSGRNLRVADPSLTLPQMLVCAAIQVGFAAAVPILAVVFLINLFVAFVFGIMQLSLREFLVAWGLVCVALLAVLMRGAAPTLPLSGGSGEMLAFWVFLTLALGRFTFVSIGASQLRAKLHERNRDLRHSLERIEHLATRDHLTGLFNRRHMSELLSQELARARRQGTVFCIAIADIDHFKSINDRYGHPTGDATLVEFARRAREAVREVDQVARWGGEEFVILLAACPLGAGTEVMERLRQTIADNDWQASAGVPTPVTCSIGLTEHGGEEGIDALLGRADAALYRAKGEGRNRVVSAAG